MARAPRTRVGRIEFWGGREEFRRWKEGVQEVDKGAAEVIEAGKRQILLQPRQPWQPGAAVQLQLVRMRRMAL